MKNLILVLLLYLIIIPLIGFIETSIAGSISINITDEGTEIIGLGGVSRVNVVSGCVEGSGVRKTEERKVSSFNAIDIDGVFDVTVELRKKQSVKVTSDDNILPKIVTKVINNTLVINSTESICPKSALEVKITADNIEKVKSDGSNDIIISRVKNKKLDLDLNGTSDVRASGKTGKFVAKVSGSGGVHAKDLHAEEVQIKVSGSGDAVVYASGKLEASIDGVGNISYYGNPKEVSKEISGVGDIEKGD